MTIRNHITGRKTTLVLCDFCFQYAYRKKYGPSDSLRYCSRDCAFSAMNRLKAERLALKKIALGIKKAKASRERKAKQLAVKALRLNKVLHCRTCGQSIKYVFGAPKLYCSKKCRPKDKVNPELKRIYKAKRKALKRGANGGENINAIALFDSMGWKCQMCGVLTPKELRGKCKARSPELDHIIPVSKGGLHNRSNLQLLCRSCNNFKSNKILPAQAQLLGM